MSSAKRVAGALNSWAREGLDMLGGADASAFEELIGDFLTNPGSDTECKSRTTPMID